MNYKTLKNAISEDRIRPYLSIANGNENQAVSLYLQNLELCEKLYYNLHWLEIILRNSINKSLCNRLGSEWYSTNIDIFADVEKNKIEKSISQLISDNKQINNPNIVANLNFGFWVNIFNNPYDNLWRYCLRKAFPKTKEATFRKDVSKRLHPILKLRNRVAHYEPILKYDLAKYNQNIIDIINWIEPEFVSYLKKL